MDMGYTAIILENIWIGFLLQNKDFKQLHLESGMEKFGEHLKSVKLYLKIHKNIHLTCG